MRARRSLRRRPRRLPAGIVLALALVSLVDRPAANAQDPPATTGRYVAVSSGGYHTCALRANGQPVCWGAGPSAERPGFGQFGLGQTVLPEGERLVAIDSGGFHTCGLRQNGTAVCWGADSGDEPRGHGQGSPPEGAVFVAISSAGAHTCGLREDGTAVCWGNDNSGQATPPEGERFASISSGSFHTCGLREDGSGVCWGPEHNSAEWEAPPENPLVVLDSADGYTCGLKQDGSPICWGGERSDEVYGNQYPPSRSRFIAISGRDSRGFGGCGLSASGTAVCWGHVDPPPERQIFTAISSGMEHTCGIRRDDGALVCWGSDEFGQSSPPDGERFVGPESHPPKLSGPDVPLRSISSGGRHVCGIDGDGTAWCWGDDGYGRSSPPPGEKFASLSSGWEHTCGIRRTARSSVGVWTTSARPRRPLEMDSLP